MAAAPTVGNENRCRKAITGNSNKRSNRKEGFFTKSDLLKNRPLLIENFRKFVRTNICSNKIQTTASIGKVVYGKRYLGKRLLSDWETLARVTYLPKAKRRLQANFTLSNYVACSNRQAPSEVT
jgi:hypothetical protein